VEITNTIQDSSYSVSINHLFTHTSFQYGGYVSFTVDYIPDNEHTEELTHEEKTEIFADEPSLPLEVRKPDLPVCCTLEINPNGVPYASDNVPDEAKTIQAAVQNAFDLIAQAEPIIAAAFGNDDVAILPNTNLPTQSDIDNFPATYGQVLANPDENGGVPDSTAYTTSRNTIEFVENTLFALKTTRSVLRAIDTPASRRLIPVIGTGPPPLYGIIEDIITPHRIFYKDFNKLPVADGTIDTLQDNMRDKLDEFTKALDDMNDLGLGIDFGDAIRSIENRIDRLQEDRPRRHLRQIRKIITRMMKHINSIAYKNGLFEDEEFITAYNKAADYLYRKNEVISVYCLALWAQAKLLLKETVFETRVINRGLQPQYSDAMNEDIAKALRKNIATLLDGETEFAPDYKEFLGPVTEEYENNCFAAFEDLLKVKLDKDSDVVAKPFQFHRQYCGTLQHWSRWPRLTSI